MLLSVVKAAFGNIAETLSIFFYKYDVVPSDILAGLLLVYDKQKTNRNSTLLQVGDIWCSVFLDIVY